MTARRAARALAVGGAVVGLAFVAALYLRPGAVFSTLPATGALVDRLDPALSLLLVAALLGLLGLARWLAGKFSGSGPSSEATGAGAEASTLYGGSGDDLAPLGAEADDRFEVATDYERYDGDQRRRARDELVGELREIAVTATVQATGRSREHAEAAVATGDWTEDRRAAGLLADEEGPSIPVPLWILDVLLGRDPFVEGVERAIAAIAAVNGDEVAATDADRSAPAGVSSR